MIRKIRDAYFAKYVYTAILIGAVIVQLGLLLNGYVSTQLSRIWRFRDMTAYERSAMFSFGEEFLDYMQFVHETVPEDATVVIPKEIVGGALGHVGIMQFFLFPRKIVDCPLDTVPECLGLANPDVYILAIDTRFPPRDISLDPKIFISFEDDRGAFAPAP